MTTTSKGPSARSYFKRGFCSRRPTVGGGEGRCRTGRNGQVHRSGCRGMGPGIQGKVRRDNVGKDHLPAGAGSNLQGPAERGSTEGGGRDLVWRMSPYVRGRRGNALRGGARHRPGGGNTRAGQRGSGHLAVPGRVRTLSRGALVLEVGTNSNANREGEGCMRVSASASSPMGRHSKESQGQNRTREIRLSGIVGGPGETWPMVEL